MFGTFFGWERKIRKLRKKWDRLREKALGADESIRTTVLTRLDQVENNLRTLEEQNLSRMDRARISKDVEISLAEIAEIIKSKPEEVRVSAPEKGERK